MRSRRDLAVAATLLTMAALACGAPAPGSSGSPGPEPVARAQAAVGGDASAPAAPLLLDAATLARYKAALPKVGWSALQAILESPSTLWYDATAIVPSYQDTVGDGRTLPIGARANSAGKAIIVSQGQRLFSADGKTWAFPLGHTAGTDASTNVVVANFLSLPQQGGQVLPVAYFTTDTPSGPKGTGFGLNRWSWIFPKGATVGEVLFVTDSSGALLPTELRVRVRALDAWATNAFRPFIHAADLSAAIQAARPGWKSQPALAALVAHLDGADPLAPASAVDAEFGGILDVAGALDVLPDSGDDTLARDLLTGRTFISAYEQAWKTVGGLTTYAASTQSTRSIVPVAYQGGLYEVHEAVCAQCHASGARLIDDFVPQAVLYGDIWGTDGIFSFHPFDPSRYGDFNTDNRAVRPALASAELVARYDPAVHPPSLYHALNVTDGTVVP